jgi:putative ABC transport system permease protein
VNDRTRRSTRSGRPHLWLIALVGLIVPRRLRADWRLEWETELRYREMLLADWDRLDRRHKLDLLKRSTSAFWDACWLQRKRLEAEVFQDLRYGVRMLLTHPGFTTVAVITLALGIGANAAIFTLLDKALIRPLAVDRPHELVTFVRDAAGTPAIFSYPKYVDLRDHNDGLSGLAAYFQRPFSLTDGARSERVIGEIVSGNYFAVLGVRPAVGRFFLPEEDRTPGTHAVAVIGYGLWQSHFAADSDVVGRKVNVNGHPFIVIGVAPAEFTGATRGTISDVYVPTMMQAQALPGLGSSLNRPNWGWLTLIGRLKPNVSREQAQSTLASLSEEPGKPAPGSKDSGKGSSGILLMDGSRGHTNRISDLSMPLTLLMGVVGFVLLIGCANVANLLLARASARRNEIAVRLAIGASRGRIVRQLLTEGTILATLGGIAGLAMAYWCSSLLLEFEQQNNFVPRSFESSFDARGLVFTFGVSILAGVLFCLAPALHTSKPDFIAALKTDSAGIGGGMRRTSIRNLLVVAQVALSLIVLIGAGLCLKSLRALQAIDPGFDPSSIVTASFDLSQSGYTDARGRQFMSDLSDRVAALPGVEAVSFGHIVAFSDSFWFAGASIEGYQPQPNERMGFDFNAVGPNYFRTLGVPFLQGREFRAQDTADAPRVIVVNEAMARRYWPGQEAVGKRTSRGEVVGVVKNSRERGLTKDPQPTIYLPLDQSYMPQLTLHVRTSSNLRSLIGSLRREVQSMDATVPIYNLRTLAEQKNGSLYTERLAAGLLTGFGLLALLLAAGGIYAVLSYSVTERTRELGIRLSQGAQPGDLLRLVIGHGMLLTLLGLVIGGTASFALTRLLARLLFGVTATDPITFVVVPLVLAGVALMACWIPARRATRMNPLMALRYE